MEDSHVPLNKWVYAFREFMVSKNGVSAHQLHRTIGVSCKTAWFLGHRIREALRQGGPALPMVGGGSAKVVEADETFSLAASATSQGARLQAQARCSDFDRPQHRRGAQRPPTPTMPMRPTSSPSYRPMSPNEKLLTTILVAWIAVGVGFLCGAMWVAMSYSNDPPSDAVQ
jgi:hypothetical protein